MVAYVVQTVPAAGTVKICMAAAAPIKAPATPTTDLLSLGTCNHESYGLLTRLPLDTCLAGHIKVGRRLRYMGFR